MWCLLGNSVADDNVADDMLQPLIVLLFLYALVFLFLFPGTAPNTQFLTQVLWKAEDVLTETPGMLPPRLQMGRTSEPPALHLHQVPPRRVQSRVHPRAPHVQALKRARRRRRSYGWHSARRSSGQHIVLNA